MLSPPFPTVWLWRLWNFTLWGRARYFNWLRSVSSRSADHPTNEAIICVLFMYDRRSIARANFRYYCQSW